MTVYLIHLMEPIGKPLTDEQRSAWGLSPRRPGTRFTACHYIGYTENLENRLDMHRKGNGARFMERVAAAGIGWSVARIWPGEGREFERHLKNQKHAARLCPICNPRAFENMPSGLTLDQIYRGVEVTE